MEHAHTEDMVSVWSGFYAGFCTDITFVKCVCTQDLSTVADLEISLLNERKYIVELYQHLFKDFFLCVTFYVYVCEVQNRNVDIVVMGLI
jgi:hypothetical protein